LTDNGTTTLKFFLHISKEEQLARFAERLEDPKRNWKISESDYTERPKREPRPPPPSRGAALDHVR
jgi:polyphosphate kinase 2 (PPK2 family)